MNIDHKLPEHEHETEREWQAQERALRDERAGMAAGDDPLLAQYRRVAHALRQPLPAPPADFARAVARAAASVPARAPVDERLERALMRGLVVVLGLSAAVATAVYGGPWLQATLALLPAASDGSATNWAFALAACVGLSWSFEQLRRRKPEAPRS